ncbi:MAG: sigma-70 family RNA polymerase sigma factor [Pseudomonadota bacterium]
MSDNENITRLFISLRATLGRAVSRIVPPKEIEDIVQETYVRVCQVVKQDEIRYPRSFMLKTAKNLALDYAKRAETRLTTSTDDNFDWDLANINNNEDDTFNRVAANQEFGHFCDAVRLLPLQCRKAFILRKVYGYSQKEIAERLDISENTVEKHIALGIKRCAYFMATLKHGVDSSGRLPLAVSVKKGSR